MGWTKATELLMKVRRLGSTMRWRATGFGSVIAGVAIFAAVASGGGLGIDGQTSSARAVAESTSAAIVAPTPFVPLVKYAEPQPAPGTVPSYVVKAEEPAEPVEQTEPIQQPESAAQVETAEPAEPVERAEPSTRSGRPAPTTKQERFILEHAAAAQASQRETGVPASVTLAQAMLESALGESRLAKEAHNYFGIKARGAQGPAGVVYMNTWEHEGGRDVTRNEPFRAYHSAEESFTDHGLYLAENPRYAEAMKHTDDPREFARLIHKAGYATDPQYANKLIRLMDTYNLYEFDL